MKRVAAAVLAAAGMFCAPALQAYLKLGTRVGADLVSLHWSKFPIRYFVTNRDVPGVTAPQLQQAVAAGLSTWAAVPGVSVTSEFVGFTGAAPISGDGMTVIGFQDRPDLERVLGSTSFTVDSLTGDVLEADIFLNTVFPWSVADAGEAGRHDAQSIAAHELGHLLGLGHSALGETELFGGGRRVLGAEAIMFPIAFPSGSLNRALKADDIAGILDLYGNEQVRGATGSITGRVTKNGAGVLGAHVVAFDPATGALVGGFTLSPDGAFTIAGLAPGLHVLRAEPLDDGEINSFVEPAGVDVDFRPAIYNRLIAVPRGGTAAPIEVKVTAK